jgi:Cys-rich repeat protein
MRVHAMLIAALLAAAAYGCTLGPEQPPGCQSDGDCGGGFTCRAGACFRDVLPDGGDGG